jgi:hypothetical protein
MRSGLPTTRDLGSIAHGSSRLEVEGFSREKKLPFEMESETFLQTHIPSELFLLALEFDANSDAARGALHNGLVTPWCLEAELSWRALPALPGRP